jgi:hypothetical protein
MKNLLQQKSFFFDKTVAISFAKNKEYKETSYEKNLRLASSIALFVVFYLWKYQ